MRLKHIEKYVLETVKEFIEKYYPEWKKKFPKVKILDAKQFAEDIGALWVKGYYDIWDNTLVFKEEPDAWDIAHETAHWSQAMLFGREEYLKLLRNKDKYAELEAEAATQADMNEERVKAIFYKKKPRLRNILK